MACAGGCGCGGGCQSGASLLGVAGLTAECGLGLPPSQGLLFARPNLPAGAPRDPVRARAANGRRSSTRRSSGLSAIGPGGLALDGDSCCREVLAWRRAGRPPRLHARGTGRGTPLVGEPTLIPSGADLILPETTIQYRAVEFRVPSLWYRAWLDEYLDLEGSNAGGSRVSSVSDCLAGVLPEFVAAYSAYRGLTNDNLDAMLGCVSLGSVADRSFFWREEEGSHRVAYRMIMRMIVAYADGIEDEYQPSGGSAVDAERCEGLGDFIRRLFQNRPAPSSRGKRCTLTVHFDAKDERSERAHAVACDDRERNCGRWYSRGDGEPGVPYDSEWEAWEDGWSEATRTYVAEKGGLEPTKPGSSSGYAVMESFQIVTHAIFLAWVGFVTDRIMHRARIAWDYYQHSGDKTYRTHARRLGRYALSTLVSRAGLFIHEAGHLYIGTGGHCTYGCCFEIAARNWQCFVIGQLGLPASVVDSPNTIATLYSGTFHGDGPRPTDGSLVEVDDALEHEFGGGPSLLIHTNGGGRCDDGLWDWWIGEGGSTTHIVPDLTRGDGRLCWSCTVESAGRWGGTSEFCLHRAWRDYSVAELDLGAGTVRTVRGGTEEWTLARACIPGDSEQMADYLLSTAWCASR